MSVWSDNRCYLNDWLTAGMVECDNEMVEKSISSQESLARQVGRKSSKYVDMPVGFYLESLTPAFTLPISRGLPVLMSRIPIPIAMSAWKRQYGDPVSTNAKTGERRNAWPLPGRTLKKGIQYFCSPVISSGLSRRMPVYDFRTSNLL
jgi:hypothetical protein